MNNKNNPYQRIHSLKATQQGAAALVMTLIILSVLTIIGITSSKTAVIETRMTTNSIEKFKSRIAAESAFNYAINQLDDFNEIDWLNTCGRNGIYDLRTTASPTCPDPLNSGSTVPAKSQAQWNSMLNVSNWSWASSSSHAVLLDKLSADNAQILTSSAQRTNPMGLVTNPQYIIGIHDPVLRPGSENKHCFPVTIVAASKGGVDSSQTFIKVNAIPESGCYYP